MCCTRRFGLGLFNSLSNKCGFPLYTSLLLFQRVIPHQDICLHSTIVFWICRTAWCRCYTFDRPTCYASQLQYEFIFWFDECGVHFLWIWILYSYVSNVWYLLDPLYVHYQSESLVFQLEDHSNDLRIYSK